MPGYVTLTTVLLVRTVGTVRLPITEPRFGDAAVRRLAEHLVCRTGFDNYTYSDRHNTIAKP